MSAALIRLAALLSLANLSSGAGRPARGSIGDADFQDQIRAPVARGLPDEGRRRGSSSSARQLDDTLALSAEVDGQQQRHAAAEFFQPLPEDREGTLYSGDAREPFTFESEEDMHALIDRAYDGILEYSRAAAGDTDGSVVVAITNDDLQEWASLVLNPSNTQLSDSESAAFNELFSTYLRRQGMAPPARMLVKRSFLRSWATTTFLQDAASELSLVRARDRAVRRRTQELPSSVSSDGSDAAFAATRIDAHGGAAAAELQQQSSSWVHQ